MPAKMQTVLLTENHPYPDTERKFQPIKTWLSFPHEGNTELTTYF